MFFYIFVSGKSYTYHINNDDYGKRLPASSIGEDEAANGEEDQRHDQREDHQDSIVPQSGHEQQTSPKYRQQENDQLEDNSESGNGHSDYSNYRSTNNEPEQRTSHPQRINYNQQEAGVPNYNYNSKAYLDNASGRSTDPKEMYVKQFEKQYKMANIDKNSEAKEEDDVEKYPSMFPQIAKLIYSHKSSPVPSIGSNSNNNQMDRSVQSQENRLSNSPGRSSQRTQEIHFSQRFVQSSGPTATTARTAALTVTEVPILEKDYLSRPIYEFITPKPQQMSGNNNNLNYGSAKYETNIESPPATGAVYPKLVSYMVSPASAPKAAEPAPGVDINMSILQEDVPNGPPPPQTPSSPVASSEGNYEGISYEHVHEMSTPPPKMHASVPPPSSRPTHYYPPKKYNPANSVKSGPDSFMTLSFEPSKEKDHSTTSVSYGEVSTAPNHSPNHQAQSPHSAQPFYHQQQQVQAQSFNPPRQIGYHNVEPQLAAPPTYQTQSLPPLPAVNSIEDQQQPPRIVKVVKIGSSSVRGYERQALQQQEPSTSQYPQPYSQYQQQAPPQQAPPQQAPGYMNIQEYPSGQIEQSPAEVLTYYRTYTNHPTNQQQQQLPEQRQQQQAQAHLQQVQPSQHYRYTGPNYQAAPEQAQASEVEPVSKPDPETDWKHNVERYAKEFGFEVPSKPGAAQLSQSPTESTSPRPPSRHYRPHPPPLSAAPEEAGKNGSSMYYFNVIYPEFAADSEPHHRPSSHHNQQSNSGRERHHHKHKHYLHASEEVLQPSRSRSHHQTNSHHYRPHYLTSETMPNVKTDSESSHEAPSIAGAKQTGDKSASKSDGSKITKEEVDEILQKYNEVINNKKASATSKPKQQTEQTSEENSQSK